MRTALVAVIAAVIGAAAGAGVMAWEPWKGGEEGRTLVGTMILRDLDSTRWTTSARGVDKPCEAEGGYNDIRQGADVVVKDRAGSIVAAGSLEAGAGVKSPPTDYARCGFSFEIPNVPDADFYSIEVSHRGALTYTRDELKAIGWSVEFKIGGD